MKTLTVLKPLAAAAFFSLCACTTQAGPHYYGYDQGNHYGNHRTEKNYDRARVIEARPIYRTIEQRVPVQECWTETVERPVAGGRSYTPTILGGLIGGAIGNAVGHNDSNKKVGAVAGALLGASVASDISSRNRGNGYSSIVRDEQRCDTRYEKSYTEEIIGYDVAYKYNDRIFQTRTQEHPGKYIRVAVDVRPLR